MKYSHRPLCLNTLIHEYRKRKGLTQKQFAQMVGRHRNHLAAIEKGKSNRITFDTYQKIMSFVLK
ncbi:MAG: hypothetical protein CVU57_11235 [Deltaproteobacteria bacterium HGW-Deltaproteobacteria-15]|nr:MAG: hypothetical protein CVU57_11235 [Deltaproteobacteria bacterium HGW-Deltaproteobacteria-15]